MQRRNFMFGGAVTLFAASPTLSLADCVTQTARDQCGPVGDRSFNSGTVNRAPDCQMDFRLPPDIQQPITLDDGSFQWVLRLLIFNAQGQVVWTIAKTIENSPVRRQGIYFGTHAAVYVTCDEYTSWYTTGAIRSCGTPSFRRVDWNLDYRSLDALELRQG
jgi:hypothetical protein